MIHRRLITELIDDSEGDRVFSQAHLQALLSDLRARPASAATPPGSTIPR